MLKDISSGLKESSQGTEMQEPVISDLDRRKRSEKRRAAA